MAFKHYETAVPVLSGGLDSVALTAILLEHGVETYPIFFNRGQGNLDKERKSIDYFNKLFSLTYRDAYHPAKEVTLATPPKEIKDFKKEVEASTEASYFMRNHIMGIVAMQYALQLAEHKELFNAPAVLVGSVITDSFADGRLDVFNALQETMRWAQPGKYGPLTYEAPFMNLDWGKESYLTWLTQNAPGISNHLHKSWSCWSGGDVHCGEDKPCLARKEAFASAGLEDYTVYEK